MGRACSSGAFCYLGLGPTSGRRSGPTPGLVLIISGLFLLLRLFLLICVACLFLLPELPADRDQGRFGNGDLVGKNPARVLVTFVARLSVLPDQLMQVVDRLTIEASERVADGAGFRHDRSSALRLRMDPCGKSLTDPSGGWQGGFSECPWRSRRVRTILPGSGGCRRGRRHRR